MRKLTPLRLDDKWSASINRVFPTVSGKAHGVNVNRLTKNTHRDQFGTPLHRYVSCWVEAL